jgi:hypothetical protein
MGFYTGRIGSVVFDGKPVAKIRDWSLDTTVELLSTNAIDSVVNTFTPGVKGATGSATLLYYRLEGNESENYTQFTSLIGKVQKIGAVTTDDRILLQLKVSDASGDDIQFYAYITAARLSVSSGELTSVPIDFTMDGDFLDNGVIQ